MTSPTTEGQRAVNRKTVFFLLRGIVEDAIECAKKGPREPFAGDPINWGAIRCAGVEYWEDDSGDNGYRVTIDECSPSCSKLQLYIGKALADSGYPHVEVRTEW